MNFMYDQLGNGKSLHLFNVIDHYKREVLELEIEVVFSLPSEQLIHTLELL
ncbi:hypothetical protein HCR_23250 (plasmid) [Hydrogenimonas cancrithermarum]|uniref:Transposase n=1 Tax=Hydrogenimonas cancrithermarum TaxID=2993563 RepID=A0ABN6X003_9BACT|nr:hypothetical protein HCR_23250 [Hydrogenimonas cancrithermarum]